MSFELPIEGTEDVTVANVSCDRIPSNRCLKQERSLAKGFGVCLGNRKVPFAARPERTGGLVGGKRGRRVRRKSAVEVGGRQTCIAILCSILYLTGSQCSSRRRGVL